jgi:hypothetical protein
MSLQPEPLVSNEYHDQDAVRQILAMLNNLKFGSLEIVVHEGSIVQIEKREKIRLNLKKRH